MIFVPAPRPAPRAPPPTPVDEVGVDLEHKGPLGPEVRDMRRKADIMCMKVVPAVMLLIALLIVLAVPEVLAVHDTFRHHGDRHGTARP